MITLSDIDSTDPLKVFGTFEKMSVLEQSVSSSIGKCEEQEEKEQKQQKVVCPP